MEIYCGNNAKDISLINNTKKLGTSYECFKKGVGVGINLPIKENLGFEPIYQTDKIFCGKKEKYNRKNYDRIGIPVECLQKGVGVGKRISWKNHTKNISNKNMLNNKKLNLGVSKFSFQNNFKNKSSLKIILFSFIFFIIIFYILLWNKNPKFIRKNNLEKSKIKIILYSLLLSLIPTLIIMIILNLFKQFT